MQEQPGRRLRIGLVGAGKMGLHHARAIGRLGDIAELVAVADRDAAVREDAARELGIAAYDDVEAMLDAARCDVVHVCTAPATHAKLARRVLERGCSVYVEKPIVPDEASMRDLLELAGEKGLFICAGHQLLFEPPMVALRGLLPALGRVAHVESFFSFRTVRRAVGGRAPMRPDEQLLDILPHPVYLLLEVLRLSEPSAQAELRALDLHPDGTAHGLVRRGKVTGTFVVTLTGRPIESYLRVSGTNGLAHADFVRGTVQRLLGPGASGIDKVLNPFRLAWQIGTGTTSALARRFLKRQRSYPGLAELMRAFYEAILFGGPAPTPARDLLDGVRIWRAVADTFEDFALNAERHVTAVRTGPLVAVTGGTGFLGRALVDELLRDGFAVRVLTRRTPAPWDRVPGIEYAEADIGAALPAEMLRGATAVVHCAAETSGGFPEHQRNSIDATANVVRAAADAGVPRVIHISSMAVLASTAQPLSEASPLEPDPRARGPYVWGKVESEHVARELADSLGVELRILRPGAIIDSDEFEPPGRLGKRIGGFFVAPGMPGGRFGTVDRTFAARVIVSTLRNFDAVPPVLNLIDPEIPTRRELVDRLRHTNPGLRLVWLPRPVLVPLSWMAVLLQKIRRPRGRAIHIDRVFADQRLDVAAIRSVATNVSTVSSAALAEIPREPAVQESRRGA